MARTFVAVFPPSEVREKLFLAARDLPASKSFRLVDREKIHLTLKFLGDVAEDELGRVIEALQPICERHEPFEAATLGFGAFPSEKRARVFWAGVGEGADPLRAVTADVENLLEFAGFERETRPYLPHLTLGRTRGRPVTLDNAGVDPPALRFTVCSVELVKSLPGRDGVSYSVIETYPF